jgi:hypothetical protein
MIKTRVKPSTNTRAWMKVVRRTFGEIDFVIAVSLIALVVLISIQKVLSEYIAEKLQMVERLSLAAH